MSLLIAIPSHDYVHIRFFECLYRLTERLTKGGVKYEVKIQSGTLVYKARDDLARYAINEGFTEVLWLDADMVFQDSIYEDLSFAKKPFVTGVYMARRSPHPSVIFSSLAPLERVESFPPEPFRIAGCGFGAVLMQVDALRQVCFMTGGDMFLPVPAFGEDLAFCERATCCGVELWCDGSVVVGHIGHEIVYPETAEQWRSQLCH